MDNTPFNIQFFQEDILQTARIEPCCKDDNIVDYAVWQNGKLQFTITRAAADSSHWVVAMKNADDDFEEALLQQIGEAIEAHEKD